MSAPYARRSLRLWLWPTTVGLLLLMLTASPLLRDPKDDGFPLSTYPMFARARPRERTIHKVVLIRRDGGEQPAVPRLFGTNEVMQVVYTISGAVSDGTAGTSALCARVARAVSEANRRPEAPYTNVSSVAVRSDTFDTLTYFSGAQTPLRSVQHARCAVPLS